MNSIGLWFVFNVFVLAMLALDLGVFHRRAHVVKLREALTWSAVWIGMALLFNLVILFFWKRMAPASEYSNSVAAMAFFTGYLIEKALSVDNIFVFIMIFGYFRVPALYQHKVLFWGIIGALVMRAICIALGVALLDKFHWLIYVFGVFLIFTGIKMLTQHGKKIDPEKNPVLKLFRRAMPISDDFQEDKFFVKQADAMGKMRRYATPLFVALLFVETSDLIFAVDSIPAILSITREPFLVYTSNVFAILGLRSLYFALSGIMEMFHLLHYGLSAILIFVGGKMLATEIVGKVPIGLSLGVIVAILAVSVVASIKFPQREKQLTSA